MENTQHQKRKVGRPRKAESDLAIRINVSLYPHVADGLRKLGGGNLSRGIAIAASKIARRE